MKDKKNSGLSPKSLVQISITLQNIAPPVWRRLIVPSSFSLADLHDIIQLCFYWSDKGNYQFIRNGQIYGENEQNVDDPFGLIYDAFNFILEECSPGESLTYIYDFKSHWEHHVFIEGFPRYIEGLHYPLCLEGKRAGPPEDIGGYEDYQKMLLALSDSKHPDHRYFLKWTGGIFCPESIDINRINAEIWSYEWAREFNPH